MFKNSLKTWLTFYRGEHAGAVFVLIIASLIALAPRIYNAIQPSAIVHYYQDSIEANNAVKKYYEHKKQNAYSNSKKGWINLHYASVSYLESKGFAAAIAKAIVDKYEANGYFQSVAEMAAYCKLDTHKISRMIDPISYKASGFQGKPKQEAYKPEIIDLNSADSILIASLPGLGMKTAARIFKYRERLGGFVSFDQLKEIWYIDTNVIMSLKPYLSIDKENIRKISIAAATEETLSNHPYCSKKQAKILIAYRKQHLTITESAFSQIPAFSAEQKSKLKNYLQF